MGKKVFVVGGDIHYAGFLNFKYQLIDNPKEADIVIFTGGADVHPMIYGCKEVTRCGTYLERDIREKEIFDQLTDKQLVIGICRGSQLMCALNGGILVQDCDNHGIFGTHGIETVEGEKYQITSTHHQMQCPYTIKKSYYDIYAWANRCTYYLGDNMSVSIVKKLKEKEPEIVIYHKPLTPRCIAIQGHPEMMRKDCDTVKMLNNLINKELNKIKK